MNVKDIEIVDLMGRINSLEILGKRYETALHKISLAERDSTSSSYEKEQDMARIARAALRGNER